MIRKALTLVGLVLVAAEAPAAPSSITEITVTDGLGYACIAPEHLEETADSPGLAFTLVGKLRLPRTCLPEPCARVLDRFELSGLTGTPVSAPRFEDEWNDYYARYADHCRKEVVPFGMPQVDQPLMTPQGFWPPLLGEPVVTDEVITRLPEPVHFIGSPALGGPRLDPPATSRTPLLNHTPPTVPGQRTPTNTTNRCNADFGGSEFWLMTDDGSNCRAGGGTAAGSNSSRPTIAPVPLPAPFWLLAAALVGLRLRSRGGA